MKIKKLAALMVIMVAGFITAAGSSIGQVKAKTKTGDDWTKAALEEYKGQYSYYKAVDINGDGTDELLLSTEAGDFFTGDARVLLVAQVDGEVREVKDLSYTGGCELFFNEDEHRLTWLTRVSGQGQDYIYEYADGELKEDTVLEYYAQNHNPKMETSEATYYINGVETDEASYNAMYENYLDESMALTLGEF